MGVSDFGEPDHHTATSFSGTRCILYTIESPLSAWSISALMLQDEFVLAAGSGAVYVVNRNKKMVKLLLAEPMSGFAIGSYGSVTRPTENINTCAFATICKGYEYFLDLEWLVRWVVFACSGAQSFDIPRPGYSVRPGQAGFLVAKTCAEAKSVVGLLAGELCFRVVVTWSNFHSVQLKFCYGIIETTKR